MALSPDSPVFHSLVIQQIANRGPCFKKMDQVIRYRDDYAIDFFSPASFLDVITKEEIIMILPSNNLKILMHNLNQDPRAKDLIPMNESSTTAKQMPMRFGIPINQS